MLDIPGSSGGGTGPARTHPTVDSLVKATHGTRSFDDLLATAQKTQYLLVKETIRAALETSPDTADHAADLLALIERRAKADTSDRLKGDQKLAYAFNNIAREYDMDLRIIANGVKNTARAQQKQKYKGADANQITDLVRLTICSKKSSEELKSVREQLKGRYAHFDNDIFMKPTGVLSSDFRIAIDGHVAQVHLAEHHQTTRADKMSHNIYEIRRDFDSAAKEQDATLRESVLRRFNAWAQISQDMMDPRFDSKLSQFDDMKDYVGQLKGGLTADEKNKLATDLGGFRRLSFIGSFLRQQSKETGFTGARPVDAKSVTDEAMKAGLQELLSLHQLIHVAYMSKAEKPWRQEYIDCADRMNAKAGRELIPESYLKLVPDVTREYKGKGLQR